MTGPQDSPASDAAELMAALRSSIEKMRANNRASNPPAGSDKTLNVGYTSGFDFAMKLVLDEITTIENAQ